jgi:hypothetical protein
VVVVGALAQVRPVAGLGTLQSLVLQLGPGEAAVIPCMVLLQVVYQKDW